MNIKGQTLFFLLMIAIVIVILALALAPALSETINNARNATSGDTLGMDCNNSSISDFDKAACVSVDLGLFYWTVGLITLAGALFATKKIFF